MKIACETLSRNTALFCDYLTDFHRLSDFFRGDPSDRQDGEEALRRIQARTYDRERIAGILSLQNRQWGAPEATLAQIERLRLDNCCAVVTGQQMGLFGGPLYTLYKAVTTVLLCKKLEAEHHTPCVPVFWIESEDHDYDEATTLSVTDPLGELREIRYEKAGWQKKTPLSSLVMDEDMRSCIAELSGYIPASLYKELVFQKISECFAPGVAYLDGFARFMLYLLGEYGLILMSPSDREFKAMMAEIFRRELETAPASRELLRTTSQKLQDRGYHLQIKPQEEKLNLFFLTPGRSAIVYRDGSFIPESSAVTMSRQDMLKRLQENPRQFSYNVALRPIVQNYLLPTAAYVGGPAEIAYWAQLGAVHAHFDVPMPLVFPRAGVTVLEGNIMRLLRKYELYTDELFSRRVAFIEERIRHQLPETFSRQRDEARECLEKSMSLLEKDSVVIERNLRPAFRRFRREMERQWDALSRKITDAYGEKDEILRKHRKKIESTVFPYGDLQERALNVVQFLVKYDRGFIVRLFQELVTDYPWRHQVMEW